MPSTNRLLTASAAEWNLEVNVRELPDRPLVLSSSNSLSDAELISRRILGFFLDSVLCDFRAIASCRISSLFFKCNSDICDSTFSLIVFNS